MPEGPEVRREADRVAAAIAGREATRVFFGLPRLKKHERKLRGRLVEGVETRGKAFLTRFEGGWVVYSHNQLYGRWLVRPAGELPRTNRQLRFAVHNVETSALLYSASAIEVLRGEDLRAHPFLAKLGPDVLDPALRPARIVRRLASPRFRGRRLGALLLDQSFLAGLGNYLRCEILFEAGLHPARRPADCDADELRRLARSTRRIARRAYVQKGVTNPRKRVRALRAAGRPRREWRFAVFARAGRPCFACRTTIRRVSDAGRRAYLCPGCQPAR